MDMDNEKELRETIAELQRKLNRLVADKGCAEYQYCSDCRTAKPISDFTLSARLKPLCYCRDCWGKQYKRYRSTEKGKASERASQAKRRTRESFRQEQRVRRILFDKMEQGLFPPARDFPCKYCGQPAVEYHHHHGYSEDRWEDVIPLCLKCHGKTRIKRTLDRSPETA